MLLIVTDVARKISPYIRQTGDEERLSTEEWEGLTKSECGRVKRSLCIGDWDGWVE